jgi:hypothetical protein
MTPTRAVAATAAALSLHPTLAHAEEADTTAGRLAGDFAIAGGLGVTVGPRGPRATADLRFRYLSSAGVFATYEDGVLIGSDAEPRRCIAFGIEVRPLFLARWATGRELGNARIDMLIDSLALELGPAFAQPAGARFGGRPGFQAGIGMELPLFPVAEGPLVALHGGARWSDSALAGGPLEGPSDRALFVTVAVGWQKLFGTSVIETADRNLFAGGT